MRQGGRPVDPAHTGRLQNEYCEYAASAVYIIHVFYMNETNCLLCVGDGWPSPCYAPIACGDPGGVVDLFDVFSSAVGVAGMPSEG
eukprot:COSAG01_NODE_1979_length_8743_cov_18.850069_3_plen_86_part_00